MLLLFGLNCLFGLSLVGFAYWLKSRRLIHNETARKLVHFAHALVVASWPVFIGYWFVIVGEIIFLGAVLVAQEYKIFHHIRIVNRQTWGEYFFPLGVIVLALFAPPIWVFVAALLLLGLADGMAAIVGNKLNTKAYKIFGHKKTVGGSLAFFIVSALIMLAAVWATPGAVSFGQLWAVIVGVPLLATIAENISPYGSDNFTIPLLVYFGVAGAGLFI